MTAYELRDSGYKPGDEIWACAYTKTFNKEGMKLVQKPIKGRLTAGKNEKRHLEILERYGDKSANYLDYFVPYKKDGTSLAWSRAVSIGARRFADTEEECREVYNKEIQYVIDFCERTIEELKEEMI